MNNDHKNFYKTLYLTPFLILALAASTQVKAAVETYRGKHGQRIVSEGSPNTKLQIMKIFQEKSGPELVQAFQKLKFDPTQYCDQDNPYLNYYIANEVSGNAIKLIDAYGDTLDPNRSDFQGKTALIIAAKVYTADDVVLALLKRYPDTLKINAQDKNGCSALHYAAAYGKENLSKALLKAGANPTLKDKKGRIPADYAKLSQQELRNILNSIEINPDRDAMAIQNYFLYDPNTNSPLKDFPSTQEGLNSALSFLAALEDAAQTKSRYSGLMITFEEKTDTSLLKNKSLTGRNWTAEILTTPAAHAKAIQGLTEAQKRYTGKSILQTCLNAQPRMQALLESSSSSPGAS